MSVEPTTEPADDPLGAGIDLADPNSPLAPLYLRYGNLAAIVLVLLAGAYARLLPLGGTDVWAQAAFGRWAAENGRQPGPDPFTPFADPDARLPGSGWLGRALFHRVAQAGADAANGSPRSRLEGATEALRVLHAVLAATFAAAALASYSRRAPLGSAGLAVLALLLVAAPPLISTPGGTLFGVVGFLAVLHLLGRPEPGLRDLLLLPPVLVLWSALDHSFVVGLYAVALFTFGRLLHRPRGWVGWVLIGTLVAAVGLTFLLTPGGGTLLSDLWRRAAHPEYEVRVFWQPLGFTRLLPVNLMVYAGLILLFVAALSSRQAYTPEEMTLLLGFTALALWKQAAVGWWFLLVPWLVIPRLPAPRSGPPPCFRKTLVGVVLAVATVLALSPTGWIREGSPTPLAASLRGDMPWQAVMQLLTPPDAASPPLPLLARGLREAFPSGRYHGTVLTNEYAGDLLLWTQPDRERPPFTHSELTLFPSRHGDDLRAILGARPTWWEQLDRYRVNLILLPSADAPALAAALAKDPAWRVLGEKESAWILAVRRSPLPPL